MSQLTPISRRRCLSMLIALPAAACSTKGPVASGPPKPPERPQTFAVMPIDPYEEIGLYYSSTGKSLIGAFTGGLGRLVAWGSEKERSQDFTALLREHGLQVDQEFRQAVLDELARVEAQVMPMADLTRSTAAYDKWDFKEFATAGDAVVYLSVTEVAYTTELTTDLRPKIYAGLSVASTESNEELGSVAYQVREDLDTRDPRSFMPFKSSRFEDADQLRSSPDLVVTALRAEFKRLAELVVRDILTIKEGVAPKWEEVPTYATLENLSKFE